MNKSETNAKIIHETLSEQTLSIYIKRLIGPIKTIIKSRDSETFEKAKRISRSKKMEFNWDKEVLGYVKTNSGFENSDNNYSHYNKNFLRFNNEKLNFK